MFLRRDSRLRSPMTTVLFRRATRYFPREIEVVGFIPWQERARVKDRLGKAALQPWVWLLGLTLLTWVCVQAGRAVMPWEKMFPDLISHWAAGKILLSG